MEKNDMEYESDKMIGKNIYEELTNNPKFDLNELESFTINYKNQKSIELIIKKGYFVGVSVETLLKYQPYDMIESIVLQYGNKKMTVKVEQIFDNKAGDADE